MAVQLKIAIVEDEEAFRQQLEGYLESALEKRGISGSIDCYPSGESFLAAMQRGSYTLVFLDIYMDKIDGLKTADTLRVTDSSCLIVFCTTSRDHMPEAFSFHAFDYIIKPTTQERIDHLMTDILRQLPDLQKFVTFESGRRQVSLLLSDLLAVTTNGHYLTVITRGGEKHSVRSTLQDFQALLGKDDRFLVINRGILVNLDYVTGMDKNGCTLADGTSLPVRVRDSARIIQVWHDYCFRQIRKDQGTMLARAGKD